MSLYGMGSIPLEAQYLYRQGCELHGQERNEAAVKCLRKAVVIAPRFTTAYRELGDCLTRLGRREDAERCYGRLCGSTQGSSLNPVAAGAR